MKEVNIIVDEKSLQKLEAFKEIVLFLNKELNQFYELQFPNKDFSIPYKDFYTISELESAVVNYYSNNKDIFGAKNIFIVESRIERNYFFLYTEAYSVITTKDWKDFFAPPHLFKYLIHSILTNLIHFETTINLEQHKKISKGCAFDWTGNKKDKRISVNNGFICNNHKKEIEQIINGKKLNGKNYVSKFESLLNFSWMGSIHESNSIANRIYEDYQIDVT